MLHDGGEQTLVPCIELIVSLNISKNQEIFCIDVSRLSFTFSEIEPLKKFQIALEVHDKAHILL